MEYKRPEIPPELREAASRLKAAGYRVIHKDYIRTISHAESFDNMALWSHGEQDGFMQHVYRNTGRALGEYLMTHGAIPIIKEFQGVAQTGYRASVTVVVDDPTFDWPYPLK